MATESILLTNRFSFDEQLMLEVQSHPLLFDKTMKEYKNRNKINAALNEISQILEGKIESMSH